MWDLAVPPLELVLRTVIVYFLFLAALRINGKREVGQFTTFDLALILLAANALQPAMTGPDFSIPGAAIIIVTIFTVNHGVGMARRRFPVLRRILEPPATVIGRDGHWVDDALQREGLDETDLQEALREHGLEAVRSVKLATLEPDGSISIVAGPTGPIHLRPRRRMYRREH